MRAVVQRVHQAECDVDGERVGSIESGLLVFLGIGEKDTENDIDYLAEKITNLRVFEDEDGQMNDDVQEIDGNILVIPQFTLFGDVRQGRRPNFRTAADPDRAQSFYDQFLNEISRLYRKPESGKFGEMMSIDVKNDGPVTLLLDSKKNF